MAGQTESQARDKWMKRLCKTTAVISILSIICTVVGAVAISKSAPLYEFPYSLGGAMIFGLLSIFSSCCVMCVYCEYGGMSKDSLTDRICCWMIVVTIFLVIAFILGVGLSGIWGVAKAQGDISVARETYWSNLKEKQAKANRDYAVATLVLILPLSVLHIIAWCQCYKYLKNYGFSDSSNRYEFTQYERSRWRQSPRDQYATRENRSTGALFSIPVPEIYYGTTHHPTAVNQASESQNVSTANPDLEQGLSFNNPSVTTGSTAEVSFSIPVPEIYYGTTQHPTIFNQASESSNVPSVNPDLEQGISFNNPSVTAGCTDRPPPAYEDIEKGGLPSYDEVVNEGHYSSAGHAEFVVKL